MDPLIYFVALQLNHLNLIIMKRVGSIIGVRPEKLEEYKRFMQMYGRAYWK